MVNYKELTGYSAFLDAKNDWLAAYNNDPNSADTRAKLKTMQQKKNEMHVEAGLPEIPIL